MLKIAVTGPTGRMGAEIIAAINMDPTTILTVALVRNGHAFIGKKINDEFKLNNNRENLNFTDSLLVSNAADVLIDFSLPAATKMYIEQCLQLSMPMVIATTGFNDAEKENIKKAAANIPIVFAPNMSLGVNLCYDLLASCAKVTGTDWQVAISEIHHKQKKDAPSGTALKMGEVITNHSGIEKSAIQFNSIRAGDAVGEHTVLFVGDGERIEIIHRASSRLAFAKGALMAAKWLQGKKPGLYSMQDVIQNKIA